MHARPPRQDWASRHRARARHVGALGRRVRPGRRGDPAEACSSARSRWASTLIDTADAYGGGRMEQLRRARPGRPARRRRRHQGRHRPHDRPAAQALRRRRTCASRSSDRCGASARGRIDVYLLHNPSASTPSRAARRSTRSPSSRPRARSATGASSAGDVEVGRAAHPRGRRGHRARLQPHPRHRPAPARGRDRRRGRGRARAVDARLRPARRRLDRGPRVRRRRPPRRPLDASPSSSGASSSSRAALPRRTATSTRCARRPCASCSQPPRVVRRARPAQRRAARGRSCARSAWGPSTCATRT